jgi:hypothetical protein
VSGNEPGWQRNKLVNIFQTYDSAIETLSKERRHYTTHALYGMLTFERMRVDKLGPCKGIPFCDDTGEGYLLVKNALLVDVVYTPQLVAEAIQEMPADLVKNRERLRRRTGTARNFGFPHIFENVQWNSFHRRRFYLIPLHKGVSNITFFLYIFVSKRKECTNFPNSNYSPILTNQIGQLLGSHQVKKDK